MNLSCQVVIIGASQAGLTMGYYLKRAGISYVILGKEKRVGDIWRNRYDSLVLFTPRWMSQLPGARSSSLDPNGYAGKDEIADELEEYAIEQQLYVRLNTEVTRLTKHKDQFIIETLDDQIMAPNVVIATGPFQQPQIPEFASHLSAEEVFQAHTSQYKNRNQLREGNVLIVGCGNSGAQIAVELASHREVYVSASRAMTFVRRELSGRSIFWWFKKLGLYNIPIHTKIGRKISERGDPIIGTELKALIKNKTVTLCPRTIQASHNKVMFNNGTQLKVSNVIWATGFKPDYSWIKIQGVINERQKPNHDRGVSTEQGLFFLGLPWQHNRGSALIGGVAADAEYIMNCILDHTEQRIPVET